VTIEQVPSGGSNALTVYASELGGPAGPLAQFVAGGAAGKPYSANRLHFSSATYFEYNPTSVHDGAPGYPLAPSTSSTSGTATVTQDLQTLWLHPNAARAILNYMRDAYRNGNLELAHSIAADYTPIFQKLAATVNPNNPDWTTAFGQDYLEAEQSLARLDANLDYYGNRAGWTPLLSLQANITLLTQEVNSAVSMLYLSFWMENYYNNAKMNVDAMNASKSVLWQDIQTAQKQYADAVTTIPDLQTQAAQVQNQLTAAQTAISQLEQRLTALAQENIAEQNKLPFWKTACRILASIAEVVPVYQPALGAIGAGLDFITNIDPNKPLDSYNQGLDIAKQFNSQLFSDSSAQLKAQLAKLDPNGLSAADYAKNVIGVYNQFAGALDKLRGSLQQSSAPQNEVDAELKKLEAQDSTFQTISEQLIQLNAQKAALAKAISDTTDVMTKASQTISANLVTLSEIDRTLRKTVQTMDLQTVLAVKDMGRRAEERLQKYLYYMAKSYEYSVVLPYPGDLRLDAVESQIRSMLASTFTTDPSKFDLILEPYRQAIRQVIQAGIDKMQLKSHPQQLPVVFDLNPSELTALNNTGQVTIDLSDRIVGLGWEEKRINDLRIDDGGITVTPPTSTGQMFINMRLTGDSILTTTYTIDSTKAYAYAFRFGTQDNPDPFSWTDSYIPSLNRLTHSQPDPATLSLLKTFLSGPSNTPLPFSDSDLATFFYAKPAAEVQLVITRSTGGPQITALRFNASISYVQSGSAWGVVSVKPASTGAPTVMVSATDATSRSTGSGAFRRVFRQGTSATFTAGTPSTMPAFLKWVDQSGNTLSNTPSINVPVSTSSTIQPIYAAAPDLTSGGGIPALSITKSHSGNFTAGQQTAVYTVTVSNAGGAATTTGMVTVTETIPVGMSLISLAGSGWSCQTNVCTRSDVLAGGASYPVITVTVNVASNAPALVTNQVSVSGGGSATASASDPTNIGQTSQNCTYVVSPLNPAISPSGGQSSIRVTTQAGCTWTVVSNVPWITIGAIGTSSAQFSVLPNIGPTRSGTITVAGQTVTVTQAANNPGPGPGLVSLNPSQGFGPNATLTLAYAHPNGWAAIQSAEFIINPRWETNTRGGGCYIKYAPGTGLFTLIADDGNSVAGTTDPGSSTNIANSQCTLNAAGSSATGSGNNLTLIVSLTVSASFGGQRHIWMQASDYNNLSTNWLVYGVWLPTQTSVTSGPWYRIYDPFSKSYLYSADTNEYNTLGVRGFVQQGISGLVMSGPTTVGGISNIAWYRVFVAATNSHFWTSDRNEFLTLINQQQAYVGEGVAAFVMPYINAQGQVSPQVTNTIPFWRAAYQGANLHFWTSDANEYNGTNGKQLPAGYKGEGIACYIFPASGAVGVGTSAQFNGGTAALSEDDGMPAVVTAVNGASYVSNGVISPGQMLTVYGRHLGGRVLLSGMPTQVIAAQDNEIRVVAPYDLAPGAEVTLEVEYKGRRSKPVTLSVVASDPAVFGTNQYGKGIAQARNEDGTTHGSEHPAARGSVVTLSTTGVGLSDRPVEVHIGGQPAEVLSTQLSGTRLGIIEVQVRVPETVEPAPFQPIVLHVGNLFSQPGVGLAIR
jgi:uncharacterized protein (TIGR03437 family)